MKVRDYLLEMGKEIDLESGFIISKNTIKQMKRKYKTADDFIKHLKSKTKLSDTEEHRIRGAYEEV